MAAAKESFEEGEWGKMNPRDRGNYSTSTCILYLNTVVKQVSYVSALNW